MNDRLISQLQSLVKMIIINSCAQFIIIKNIPFLLFVFSRKTVLENHLLLSSLHVWPRCHKTVSTRPSVWFLGWDTGAGRQEHWAATGSLSGGRCPLGKAMSCSFQFLSTVKLSNLTQVLCHSRHRLPVNHIVTIWLSFSPRPFRSNLTNTNKWLDPGWAQARGPFCRAAQQAQPLLYPCSSGRDLLRFFSSVLSPSGVLTPHFPAPVSLSIPPFTVICLRPFFLIPLFIYFFSLGALDQINPMFLELSCQGSIHGFLIFII